MKLYGKREIKRKIERRAQLNQPDRDAIIWSVNTTNNYAYVKIQGSDTQIKAHYPGNWDKQPFWLKAGNAVRVRHKTGNRGYVEIIGNGRAIPSPVEGASTLPTFATAADAILTGMRIVQTRPDTSMAVAIESGTYRISGVTYTFAGTANTAIEMEDPPVIGMVSAGVTTMGEGQYTVTLAAAPVTVGKCRYDSIVIGTDGVVDVVQGAEADTDSEAGPTLPSTPANHVFLNQVYVQYGTTEITGTEIGYEWKTPVATELDFSCGCTDCVLDWDAGDNYPECIVTLSVEDQYGNANTDANGVQVEITMYGTGTLQASEDAAFHDENTSGYGIIWGSSCQFTYKRDQTETTERSPVFNCAVLSYPNLQCIASIRLGDEP